MKPGIQKLQEEREALLREVEKINVRLAEETANGESVRLKHNAFYAPRSRRPIRELVLEALQDLSFMTYSRLIALYIKARYGRELPPTRFGTLSVDEQKAFHQGRPRQIWLCHGLTYDRGLAVKRLWAESTWNLSNRILAPTTGRVQHLKMAARLAELARAPDRVFADSDMLRMLAADHARDLPGVIVRRGKFELDLWFDTANKLLAEIEPHDKSAREEAASKLRPQLNDASALFGVPEDLVVLPGGLEKEVQA